MGLFLAAAFVLGALAGAGVMSVLYERNTIGSLRRSVHTRRISQLDVFELPKEMQQDAARRSESRLSKAPPKQ